MGYPPTTEQDSELSESTMDSDETISQNSFSAERMGPQVAVTAAQLRVVQAIQMMVDEGVEPKICAIAGRTNLSKSGVQKYVSRLRRLGVIAEEGYAVRRAPTGVMLTAQVVGWRL